MMIFISILLNLTFGKECYDPERSWDYTGSVDVTVTGEKCMNWRTGSTHRKSDFMSFQKIELQSILYRQYCYAVLITTGASFFFKSIKKSKTLSNSSWKLKLLPQSRQRSNWALVLHDKPERPFWLLQRAVLRRFKKKTARGRC